MASLLFQFAPDFELQNFLYVSIVGKLCLGWLPSDEFKFILANAGIAFVYGCIGHIDSEL